MGSASSKGVVRDSQRRGSQRRAPACEGVAVKGNLDLSQIATAATLVEVEQDLCLFIAFLFTGERDLRWGVSCSLPQALSRTEMA